MMHVESSQMRNPSCSRESAHSTQAPCSCCSSAARRARRGSENVEHVLGERPDWLRFLYTRYVAMNVPKNMQSRAQEGPHEQLLVTQTRRRIVFLHARPYGRLLQFATYFSVYNQTQTRSP